MILINKICLQPEVMEYASACVDSSFNRASAPACLSSIDPIATSNGKYFGQSMTLSTDYNASGSFG